MGEGLGVVMALISSALGGSAAAVTRYLVADGDAILLANLRFGIGFLCVLPIAIALRATWPRARDWPSPPPSAPCSTGWRSSSTTSRSTTRRWRGRPWRSRPCHSRP